MKKGEIQIEVLIAIIIGIFVLAFVIYGFTKNWDIFTSKICSYGNCESNVDAIQNACELACLQKNQEEYCKKMTLKLGTNEPKKTGNCKELYNFVSNPENKITGITINPCPEISCLK